MRLKASLLDNEAQRPRCFARRARSSVSGRVSSGALQISGIIFIKPWLIEVTAGQYRNTP
jgi:hypothetical protein